MPVKVVERAEIEALYPPEEVAATPAIPDADPPIELWGYGPTRTRGGRWLACRLSTLGAVEVLTPMRHGEHYGETRHACLSRLLKAMQGDWR